MPTISEGSDVGPYRVLEPLPELRSGALIEAWLSGVSDRQDRVVLNILRVPHQDLDSEHQRAYEMLRKQVDILERSRHLNIVRIYPLLPEATSLSGEYYLSQTDFRDESWWFWVMEYPEGGSLKRRLEEMGGRLSLEEAAEVIYQVAAALDYLHSKGIVHLNIRPGSVFFRYPLSGPSPKVELLMMHFEDAMSAEEQVNGLKIREELKAYVAPERFQMGRASEDAVDNRPMDVYALGVLFYRMLAGTLPFVGRDQDLERIIREGKPRPLQRFDVPPELKDIIFQMLEKEPARRPPIEQLMLAIDMNVPPPRKVGARVAAQPSVAPMPSPEPGRPTLRRRLFGPPAAPTLIEPADDAWLDGRVVFAWDWKRELKDDEAFELRIWRGDEYHARVEDPQRETDLDVDLDALMPDLPGEGDECFWSVVVVREHPYESLTEEAAPRRFNYGEQPEREEEATQQSPGKEEAQASSPSLLGRVKGLFTREIPAPILVKPSDGQMLKGQATFTWQWDGNLKKNHAFELRIWREGQSHEGVDGSQRGFEQKVDLDALIPNLPGAGDKCLWSVAVVQTSPYKSLSDEAEPQTFLYEAQSMESAGPESSDDAPDATGEVR